MINAIACVSSNWAIGRKNKLLFRLKPDMEYFKNKTSGQDKVVVMGYNTAKSLPKAMPLAGRFENVVLCGPADPGLIGFSCVRSLDQLLCRLQNMKYLGKEIWIIGGAMFYRTMLPYCDRAYVTKVDKAVDDADAFFPDLSKDGNFYLARSEAEAYDKASGLTYAFEEYRRLSLNYDRSKVVG